MKRLNFLFLPALIVFLFQMSSAQFKFNTELQKPAALTNIKSMPLTFTQNRGQWNDKALYKADAGGATFWFCKDEVAYVFTRDTDELLDDGLPHGMDMPGLPDKFNHPRYKKEAFAAFVKFVGAKLNAEIVAEDRLDYNCNYFYGNDPSKWATDVPNYSSITYKDIYPGIDLKYHGDGLGMKYDFIVSPGTDISQIKIKYDGVENLSVTNQGDLEAQTKFGPIHERIPQIYQEIEGQKRDVSGHYILRGSGVFGFALEGGFNPAYQLIIDPSIIYSTYLGGSGYEGPSDMTVDAIGCAYLAGSTPSSDFPIYNPYDGSINGYEDFYVTAFTSSGSSLKYSTFIGGNSEDYAGRMAIDRIGNVFLTGYTISSDFPLVNPYQYYHGQNWDGIVLKLSALGNALIYSTYFGGTDGDELWGLAIDSAGCAYVTGMTQSVDLPASHGCYDPSFNGGDQGDAFLAKLSQIGNSLIFCTYLGGAGGDLGYCIVIPGDGCPILTGITDSGNFPTLNAYDGTLNGMYDIFVSKFDPLATSLIFSTYLGGSLGETPQGIHLNNKGSIYLTGETSSPDFPMVNAYDSTLGDPYDAYIAKLSGQGSALLYSTFLGGMGWDMGSDIDIDPDGNIYVTGYAGSDDFPLINPFDSTLGWRDCYVAVFNRSANEILFSTFLGGSGEDVGASIVVDRDYNIYVMGRTGSTDFPLVCPFDTVMNDFSETFLTKISATVTGIEDDELKVPEEILISCYPNPFNAAAHINYALAITGYAQITIFDLLGQKVVTLIDRVQNAGEYSIIWNAADVPSGIYFARLETTQKSDNIKMVLLK